MYAISLSSAKPVHFSLLPVRLWAVVAADSKGPRWESPGWDSESAANTVAENYRRNFLDVKVFQYDSKSANDFNNYPWTPDQKSAIASAQEERRTGGSAASVSSELDRADFTPKELRIIKRALSMTRNYKTHDPLVPIKASQLI